MWKNGRGRQRDVADFSDEHVLGLGDIRGQVPVREHDTLAAAGGARRVRQHDDVVVGHRHLLGERLAGEQVEHRRHTLDRIDRHDLGDVGALDCLAGHVEEHRDRHEHRGVGVLKLMADLSSRVGRVDRRDDAACVGDTVEEERVLGDVRRHERKRRARAEAGRGETTGEQLNALAQVRVGDRAARRTVDDRRLVRQLIGHAKRVVRDRNPLGNLDVGQGRSVDHAGSS